jgi:putative ABC transport system permease protein
MALERALRDVSRPGEAFLVESSRSLRQGSLEIFDRTFRVTGVLRLLTLAVAVIGVLAALTALELERAREFAVLRANGLLPRQLVALILGETTLLGLAAGLFAVPLGTTLAALLIYVVNRRSFGWTMELAITPRPFVVALGLSILAAWVAGVYPAWRSSRTSPAAALRAE